MRCNYLSYLQTSTAAAVEVWEWISNFIPRFTKHMITYPWWDKRWSMLVSGAPGHCPRGCVIIDQVTQVQVPKYCIMRLPTAVSYPEGHIFNDTTVPITHAYQQLQPNRALSFVREDQSVCDVETKGLQWPLLLTWFNLNRSMDK